MVPIVNNTENFWKSIDLMLSVFTMKEKTKGTRGNFWRMKGSDVDPCFWTWFLYVISLSLWLSGEATRSHLWSRHLMGGASWGLCASGDRLALAWPIRKCCQFKAMNPRGNYILNRKKILWKYFTLGNVCIMEDIISPPCNLFVLWSFGFLCSK